MKLHTTHIPFLLSVVLSWTATQADAQSIYTTDWQYSGDIEIEAFGWSLCNAGDVNGDGYDDLLVAAIDHSEPIETEEEEGKLYLFTEVLMVCQLHLTGPISPTMILPFAVSM